jgi:hypothetical protein
MSIAHGTQPCSRHVGQWPHVSTAIATSCGSLLSCHSCHLESLHGGTRDFRDPQARAVLLVRRSVVSTDPSSCSSQVALTLHNRGGGGGGGGRGLVRPPRGGTRARVHAPPRRRAHEQGHYLGCTCPLIQALSSRHARQVRTTDQ